MTVHELKLEAYRRKCDALAIDRLISSIEWDEVWNECGDEDRCRALEFFNKGDRLGLQSWFRTVKRRKMTGKGISELRRIARLKGVEGWHAMSKDDLIERLGA